MPDIFLSYNREDQLIARRFAEAFEREGFSVWWDATLRSGEDYDEVTGKALKAAKAVVVLWSGKSVASRWVRTEATIALQRGTLMPVMIEPCERPIMFELTHTSDLTHWTGSSSDPAWRGYVAHLRENVSKGEPALSDAPTPVTSLGPRSFFTPGRIAILSLLVLGAGLLFWFLRPHSIVATMDDVSLAVLPFADISAEQNQEYISDGLSEEILNQLAQIKALRVVARTSSFSFKGKDEDLRVIGQKLGVNHLLEGSVRKNGEQLRITAQLINAADGSHLWSHTYARKMDDVFAVQEEIAKDVAKALSITLDVGELRRAEGGTTNVAAYEKYLQARAVSMNSEGAAASEQVAQLTREAVALDPGFSLAWGLLQRALGVVAFFFPERIVQLQKEAADARAHVIALTPDAPWVKTLIALELVGQHKWMEAESALRQSAGRSATASGQDPDALPVWFLFQVGRIDDALRANDQALKREPLSLAPSMERQILLDAAGRPLEAQAEYERSLAFAKENVRLRYLALLRLMRQEDADPGAIQARIKELFDVAGPTQPAVRPMFFGLAGAVSDPQNMLAEMRKAMEGPVGQDNLSLVIISDMADAFGERDLALQAMRRNYVDLRFEPNLAWQPFKSSVRADPMFKQIVQDIGLVDYWRKTGKWGDFCKPVGDDDFQCH